MFERYAIIEDPEVKEAMEKAAAYRKVRSAELAAKAEANKVASM